MSSTASSSPVLRNTLFLAVAQAITTPISILVQAVMARHIGAAAFGQLYLATTLCTFGFILVDWGQALSLPRLVATDRSRASALLGSGLVWRLLAAAVVSSILAVGVWRGGDEPPLLPLRGLVALGLTLASISGACQDVVRGFERTDFTAYVQVGGQLLMGAASVTTVLLGGDLLRVLMVQAACSATMLLFVGYGMRRLGLGRPQFDSATLTQLLRDGAPLLLFGFALALQPNVDALYLSRFVSDTVIGWHAAAQRLVGFLAFPAVITISALYPTLARLHVENEAGFVDTTRKAIRGTSVLAVPVALGCLLFPEIGIGIFSRSAFGAAESNLRILALFLFLLYFSMPIGCSLLAAGKQRTWSLVQCLCVLISVGLDPLLIPWFQTHHGNGGLGVCVASVVSETCMIGLGLWLSPRGLLDRATAFTIGLTLGSGAVAAIAVWAAGYASFLGLATPWVRIPLLLGVYLGALMLSGGIDADQLVSLRSFVMRKLRRV